MTYQPTSIEKEFESTQTVKKVDRLSTFSSYRLRGEAPQLCCLAGAAPARLVDVFE